MREQKYAKVLEEYEEKLKQYRTIEEAEEELEEEEKLSVTRELKFKELQEAIDNSHDDEEIEEKENSEEKPVEDILDTESMLDDEDDPLEKIEKITIKKDEEKEAESKKSEKKPKKKKIEDNDEKEAVPESKERKVEEEIKIEKVSGKSDLDDLYLTTSFKPFRKRFKFSNFLKKLVILMIIFGGLGAIGYYIVYPIVYNYMASRPEKVFEASVDYVADIIIDNKELFLGNENNNDNLYFNFDNNKMILEIFGGFNYSLNASNIETSVSESIGIDGVYNLYLDGNKVYYDYSTIEDSNFSRNTINVSDEDFEYIIKKLAEITKSLIIEDNLSQEKDEIMINGERLAVVRNTYNIDADTAKIITDRYYEAISGDEKMLEFLASSNNMTVREYENYINNLDIRYDSGYKAAFNIYTINGTTFVGVDFERNGFRLFYYYKNENKYNIYLNLDNVTTCHLDISCSKDNRFVLEINGIVNENNLADMNVKYNDKNIASFKVRDFKLIK